MKRENDKRSHHDTVIDHISHVTVFSGDAGYARGRSLHRHHQRSQVINHITETTCHMRLPENVFRVGMTAGRVPRLGQSSGSLA